MFIEAVLEYKQDFCLSLAGVCFPKASFSLVCSWTAIIVCISYYTCIPLNSAVCL